MIITSTHLLLQRLKPHPNRILHRPLLHPSPPHHIAQPPDQHQSVSQQPLQQLGAGETR